MKLRTNVLVFLALLLLSACSGEEKAQLQMLEKEVMALKSQLEEATTASTDGKFIHTVFFWMNEGNTAADIAAFEAGLKQLAEIETVQRAYIGKPAGTPRDVVDNSYDYALILHFTDAAGQNAYQIDPVHLAFIEASQGTWAKVQVYDTLAE